MIRPAVSSDAAAIASLYNYYVENTAVTFEEEPLTADTIHSRLTEVQTHNLPWIVAEYEGELIGYAYATPYHKRSAYRHSVETTIYLKHDFHGRGFGKLLYDVLLKALKEKGFHVAIGVLGLPNEKSAALHEKLGFEKVGHLNAVGFKFNQWRDVGYWQMML